MANMNPPNRPFLRPILMGQAQQIQQQIQKVMSAAMPNFPMPNFPGQKAIREMLGKQRGFKAAVCRQVALVMRPGCSAVQHGSVGGLWFVFTNGGANQLSNGNQDEIGAWIEAGMALRRAEPTRYDQLYKASEIILSLVGPEAFAVAEMMEEEKEPEDVVGLPEEPSHQGWNAALTNFFKRKAERKRKETK